MSLLQNVITVAMVLPHHIYRPHSITEIFPIPAVITVVTAVLPLSPLLCHPLDPTMVEGQATGSNVTVPDTYANAHVSNTATEPGAATSHAAIIKLRFKPSFSKTNCFAVHNTLNFVLEFSFQMHKILFTCFLDSLASIAKIYVTGHTNGVYLQHLKQS